MIYMIVFSIFGIYHSTDSYEHLKISECSILNFVDVLDEGGNSYGNDHYW